MVKKDRIPYRYQQNSIQALVPLILNYTVVGDVVADCFDGVGTTSVISSALGRVGVGIDFDNRMKEAHEKYVAAVNEVRM